jgi:Rod binding domain-containing protein
MEAAGEAGTGLHRVHSPRQTRTPEPAEAAREFEAYILKVLLQEMRKSVHSGGLFEDKSTDGYRALLDDALARRAAEAGTFGLAEQMLRQWGAER